MTNILCTLPLKFNCILILIFHSQKQEDNLQENRIFKSNTKFQKRDYTLLIQLAAHVLHNLIFNFIPLVYTLFYIIIRLPVYYISMIKFIM